MKKVAFYTLGCKVNQYETKAIENTFKNSGYTTVNFNEFSDIYIINTCTVTSLSDRKSRQIIRGARKRNEQAIIIVTGCYAQTSKEEVSKIEEVNLVVGTQNRNKIIETINNNITNLDKLILVDDIMKSKDFEKLKIEDFEERTRAYIKIQDGCNQFCSYCIIPYARGPIRSRELSDINDEIYNLVKAGFKEVVLTGIHLASYGKDKNDKNLIDAIKVVNDIDGIKRIRLGSLEPNLINEDFINQLLKFEKVCPHFHLSLQSGCNKTLKNMNRKYTTKEYFNATQIIRSKYKNPAITTDIIVGFPGETDQDFRDTFNFVRKINFSKIHVFKYSPRKGTKAANFKNQMNGLIKEERSKALINISNEMSIEYNKLFIGNIVEIIVEKQLIKTDILFEGHTKEYIKVVFEGNNHTKGDIVNLKIISTREDYLFGEIV